MRWLLLVVLLLPNPVAQAGPLEARALLDEARTLPRTTPWTERIQAYRRAFLEAHPTDRTRARALKGIARILKAKRFVHGALAVQARAAWRGPERDRGRLSRLLDLALHLRREGDLESAAPHLEQVIHLGRTISRHHADRALDALSQDLADQGDLPALETLLARYPITRSAPHVRLQISNRVGLLRLAAGDRRGAERAYHDARRLWRQTADLEGKEATRCARIWLDYELRVRLERLVPP